MQFRFTSLRSVPAYEKAVQETFDRCLDLYLCPRVHKKRVRIGKNDSSYASDEFYLLLGSSYLLNIYNLFQTIA